MFSRRRYFSEDRVRPRRVKWSRFNVNFFSDKGKPETPHDIRVTDVTSSTFKIQFSPSFDGGGGPQRFLIEVTLHDKNTTFNSSVINQQLPFNTYEYIVKGKEIWFRLQII